MTDYLWPEDLAPFGQSFYLQPHRGGTESPFNRQTKVYLLSAPRWVARMSFRGGYDGTVGAAAFGPRLDAQIARLEGGANRTGLYDFRRNSFRGITAVGSNLAAVAGASSITLTGMVPGEIVRAGDYIGGDERPHIIVEDATVGADGRVLVSFKPPLAADVDGGEATLGYGRGWFRLNSDDAGQNPTEVGGLSSYDLEFTEDWSGGASVETTNLLHGLTPAITNVTDGGTGTATLTETVDGLKISAGQFNKHLLVSTDIDVANTEIRLTATIKVASISDSLGVGLGFTSGGNRASFEWTNGGFFTASSNYTGGPSGTISSTMPTYASGATLTMQFDVTAAGAVYVTCSADGGRRVAFGFTGIPAAAVSLAYFDNTTLANATFKIVSQEMAAYVASAPVREVDSSLVLRSPPAGFVASRLPSWLKIWKRPGTRFFASTLDLQPILSKHDHTVFVQYVDVVTGSDSNPGTAAAPLKSIHAALSNTQTGSRAFVKPKGGLYGFNDCWKSTGSGAVALQVMSWDGEMVISSMHDTGLTWSLNSGATYQATFTGSVVDVFDAAHLTSDGDYTAWMLASSLAECQTTQGVLSTTSLVGGSGGATGTFSVAFSGGGGSGAAASFTVAGGAVTSITITSKGTGYTSAPTMSFAASAGLIGASATAVIGPPGAYFISGTTIYGHASDGRSLIGDLNIRVYKKAASDTSLDYNGLLKAANSQRFLHMIAFEGGNYSLYGQLDSPSTTMTVYGKNCTFKYSGQSAPIVNGDILAIWQNCIAAWNTVDGFHANPIFGSAGASMIQMDCISRWNGRGGDPVNNSSSNHGGWTIAFATRAGWGDYHHAEHRGIHDIRDGTDSYSWYLGIISRDSRNGYSNYTCGLGTGNPKAWLDTCTSAGATYDLEAQAGATIYTSDFVGAATNTGAGTITPYVP